MVRSLGPVLGALLVAGAVSSAAAQRPPSGPDVTLEAVRPNPVLPAALIPFVISPEVCRRGERPLVTLTLSNQIGQADTLSLRGSKGAKLDGRRLGCGTHVAFWDGTLDGGTRIAPPQVYWLQLTVDGLRRAPVIITKVLLVRVQ